MGATTGIGSAYRVNLSGAALYRVHEKWAFIRKREIRALSADSRRPLDVEAAGLYTSVRQPSSIYSPHVHVRIGQLRLTPSMFAPIGTCLADFSQM